MDPRTIVITGGNSGLGLATATALRQSAPHHRIVVASRHRDRAEAAVERLRQSTPTASVGVEAMTLDLASFSSIRAFVAALETRLSTQALPPLGGLVCNAAYQGARTLTADGFESTFGVNHLGHFLLANLAVPLLADGGRIVVVASSVHDPVRLADLPSALASMVPPPAWNDPVQLAHGLLGDDAKHDGEVADRGRRYSTSKLANLYFTYALARRLPAGMTVNAVNPGLMPGTGLVRQYAAPMRFLWQHVMPRIIPLLRMVNPDINTATASGKAVATLLLDPALAGVSGAYFEGGKPVASSDASYDAERTEKLWEASATLTNLAAPS